MTDFTVGSFIAWNGGTDTEKFSYVGRVVSFIDNFVKFEVGYGIVGTPINDGVFKNIKQPVNWGTNLLPKELRAIKREANQINILRKKRVSGQPTKIELILELFKHDVPASRKEAIKLIVTAGITTPAGASTFWHKAKELL